MIIITIAPGVRHLKNRTTPVTLPRSKRVVEDTAPDVIVIETEDGVDYYEETVPGEWRHLRDADETARIFLAMEAAEAP
jgi:hypothetical protein